MKTEALKQALDRHGFDAAIGGARRDEEKSRAKERVFSLRGAGHVWEPRRQRPELWHLYNTRLAPGETMRVFPLSNWTELDVWDYIAAESDPGRAALFRQGAAGRRRARACGSWSMTTGCRCEPGEAPEHARRAVPHLGLLSADRRDRIRRPPRSRTSSPNCAEARVSERQGRLIDSDEEASMERKKREGYF